MGKISFKPGSLNTTVICSNEYNGRNEILYIREVYTFSSTLKKVIHDKKIKITNNLQHITSAIKYERIFKFSTSICKNGSWALITIK
jgi:hypothetical protein